MTQDQSNQGLLHEEITSEIIGAAMEVLNELRPGLDEKLYERALIVELQNRGRKVDQQKSFRVEYKGVYIGALVPDLIVDDLILVETKAVDQFHDSHTAQVIGYLAITQLRVGLLLNFKKMKLDWKRLVR